MGRWDDAKRRARSAGAAGSGLGRPDAKQRLRRVAGGQRAADQPRGPIDAKASRFALTPAHPRPRAPGQTRDRLELCGAGCGSRCGERIALWIGRGADARNGFAAAAGADLAVTAGATRCRRVRGRRRSRTEHHGRVQSQQQDQDGADYVHHHGYLRREEGSGSIPGPSRNLRAGMVCSPGLTDQPWSVAWGLLRARWESPGTAFAGSAEL